MSHERRMQLLSLGAGLPAVVATVVLLWIHEHPADVRWGVSLVVIASWLAIGTAVRNGVASPLRTIANLLEAVRRGDFSIRARSARGNDALSEILLQLNAMSATLWDQRLGAMEAATLLRKVMEEIDVAIYAFDDQANLRLVNRAGFQLLRQEAGDLIGQAASAIGLAEYLEGEDERTVRRTFPGGSGRWRIRRSGFREGGLPHQLLVIADLTRPLREEELQAWQRLVRVLGHELNNSLTPIKSIAESLASLLRRSPRAEDWEEDMQHGLHIISTRSAALSRFLSAYAELAKLPTPKLGTVEVDAWVRRVSAMESRVIVQVDRGPAVSLLGDADQLEQALINLVRNAADVSVEGGKRVNITWSASDLEVSVYVRDEGPGLANTANLFVPFFTTKPGGSGIGLVLSRQIAEAHGGTLTLKNREDRTGCEATLAIPRAAADANWPAS